MSRTTPRRRARRRVRSFRVAPSVGVVMMAAALAGCGSSGTSHMGSSPSGRLEGLLLNPPERAAPLVLNDYTGQSVSLATLRGKAVFVTFVYTHCPDVCPLIVSNLASAERSFGAAARDVRILAVTVDPGRDTPTAIRRFLAARNALGRMDYLLGSRARLRATWRAWHVEVISDNRLLTTGHSAVVYGITASGRVAVVYPSDFTPAQIIHDAPLLAGM
jgi:protein SCO1/2